MVQPWRSSARISASVSLPKLVRSPHRATTSAASDISSNIARYRPWLVSLTWRSPIAARVIGRPCAGGVSVVGFMLLVHSLADDVRETPFGDVDDIVRRADQPASADLDRGG